MMNKTRKSLLTSVLSLLLCCAMLVGTTFAWFTDSATSAINKIQAGNLDIEVYYATQEDVVDGKIADDKWKVLNETDPVFNQNALWEPGYAEVAYFKFVNKGTLALEYQMNVDIIDEKAGINVAGELFTLSDYIQAYCNNSATWGFTPLTNRDMACINPPYAPAVWSDKLSTAHQAGVALPDGTNPLALDSWQWLEPNEEYYCTLVLFMPTTVGNEANYGELKPTIDLGINVIATQYNWVNEKDSFDQNYDENAVFPEKPNPENVVTPAENIVLSENFAEAGAYETVSFADKTINGNIIADKTVLQITFDEVELNGQIVLDAENTIVLQDCDITVPAGEKLIVNNSGALTIQVMYNNVTVNGEKLTSANWAQYADEGVTFFAY